MTTAAPDTNGDDNFDKAFDGFAMGTPAADSDLDADLDAGDAGEDGQALTEGDEADRQAAAALEEDPLASLPEDVRRRIQEAEERATQAAAALAAAEHAARSNAGRVSALQRKVDELQKSPRTEKAGGADDGAPGSGSDTDDSSFGEEFSEVADFVQRTVEKKVAPLQAKLDEQEAEEASRQEQAELAKAFKRLATAHPDFDQIRNNPEYGDWLKKQAPGVRNLTASQDPEDAIALCSMFKSSKVVVRTPSREDLLAAAEEIPSKGGSRRSGVPDDYDSAFDHFAKKR